MTATSTASKRTPSPLELEIKFHYYGLDAQEGPWDCKRVTELCKLLKITHYELGALARVPPSRLMDPLAIARLPKSVKLLLSLIERSAHSAYLGKQYATSLFPTLPHD